ncbi:MAG: inositol monophosphatase family protein, partial [Pseudomonadota bacterium]
IGFINQPYTGELFVADGNGAFLIARDGNQQRLRTRKNCALKDAILFTTSPKLFTGDEHAAIERLESQVKLSRYGTDCYGAALVAAGYADIWIEAGLQPYDIVGIVPLIEQAGGIVTTINGDRPEDGGTIIACGSSELHSEAIAAFNG